MDLYPRAQRIMTPSAETAKAARTLGWPSSPSVLFGIAAAFFVVLGIVVRIKIFGNRLPFVWHGQTVPVPAGYLVLLVAGPFAIFGVIYAGIELGARRAFQEPATRIHFVCTLFAVLDVVRVYGSWAITTGNMQRASVTWNSFGGAIAFLGLGIAAFVWNLFTTKPRPGAAR